MSVAKRTWTGPDGRTKSAWEARWTEGTSRKSRSFARKQDAVAFEAEIIRRRRMGPIADVDAGTETLDEYMAEVWVPTYWAMLAPKTQVGYDTLYRVHLRDTFGNVALREITAERINRWQSERLKGGAGKEATRKALTLLGGILQRATEGGRIQTNPARLVRKAKVPKPAEVRPLAPARVEALRAALLNPSPVQVAPSADGKRNRRGFLQPAPGTPQTRLRDATFVSVLAYGGLRPGEALALRWGDVREKTLLIERAFSLGQTKTTKTGESRSVRLLAPLAADLREWKLAAGRPTDKALVFPGMDLDNWRSRAWARAVEDAGVEDATPYTLRHSFASLLIHEGRNVIYVARQLGHGAELTLGTYGHVMEELEDAENMSAEEAIEAARSTAVTHERRIEAN